MSCPVAVGHYGFFLPRKSTKKKKKRKTRLLSGHYAKNIAVQLKHSPFKLDSLYLENKRKSLKKNPKEEEIKERERDLVNEWQ